MAGDTTRKMGFSTLSRIESCPGSFAACEGLPNPSSEAATLGTDAHTATATAFQLGGFGANYMPNLSEAYLEAADEAVAITRGLVAEMGEGTVVLFEQKADTSRMLGFPEGTIVGTSDVQVVNVAKGIGMIIDYKFGMVPVPASTPQNRMGLASLAERYPELHTFISVIIQPRAPGREDSAESITYTREEILGWRDEIQPKLQAAITKTAPRSAGLHCRYCRAMPVCSTYRDLVLSTVQGATDVNDLSDGQIAAALTLKGVITDWLDAVSEEGAKRAAVNPDCIPGYCIGSRVTHRKWGDDREVLALIAGRNPQLLDELAPRKLASPSKILAAVDPDAADELQLLVVKTAGAPTLIRAEVAARRKKPTAEQLAQAWADLERSQLQFDDDL